MIKKNSNKRSWTVQIKDGMGNTYYLYRYNHTPQIHLVNNSETPLGLSTLTAKAPVLRLELEQCLHGVDALKVAKARAEYAKEIILLGGGQ